MKPQKRGDLTEAAVLQKLMQEGYSISQPFDDNQRYDFIADSGNELYRVQAKTARMKEGKLKFDCANSVANTVEMKKKTYTSDDIDSFVVYSPDLESIYWVPVEETPETAMTLRLEETKSGQSKGINWAEDYKL